MPPFGPCSPRFERRRRSKRPSSAWGRRSAPASCRPGASSRGANARRRARDLTLDAAPGADDARTERPSDLAARPRRWDVRDREPPAGRGRRTAAGRRRLGGARLSRGYRDGGDACSPASAPNADDLDRLDALVERMWRGATDFDVYRRADIRFHVGLAEAARSPRLVSAMTEVQGRMSELITRLAASARAADALERAAPARSCACCASGTPAAAVRLMREHIEGTEHILAGLSIRWLTSVGGALDERAPLGVRGRRATARRAEARSARPTGIRSSISSVEPHTPAPTAASAAAPAAVASSSPR